MATTDPTWREIAAALRSAAAELERVATGLDAKLSPPEQGLARDLHYIAQRLERNAERADRWAKLTGESEPSDGSD